MGLLKCVNRPMNTSWCIKKGEVRIKECETVENVLKSSQRSLGTLSLGPDTSFVRSSL